MNSKKTVAKALAAVLAAAQIGSAVITGAAVNVKPIEGVKPIVVNLQGAYISSHVPLDIKLQTYLHSICKQYKVDYCVALGVIEAMSGFDHSFREEGWGGVERVGLMGVPLTLPSQFEDLKGLDPYDIHDNIRMGVYLLSWLRPRHAAWDITLLCYDVGEGNALRYFTPWGETTPFAHNAIEAARRWFKIIGE